MDPASSINQYKSTFVFNAYGQAAPVTDAVASGAAGSAQLAQLDNRLLPTAPQQMTTMMVGEGGGGDMVVIGKLIPAFYGNAPDKTSDYLAVVDAADKLGNKDGVMDQTELTTYLSAQRDDVQKKQTDMQTTISKIKTLKDFVGQLPDIIQVVIKPIMAKVDLIIQAKQNLQDASQNQLLAGQEMSWQFGTFALASDSSEDTISQADVKAIASRGDGKAETLTAQKIQLEINGSPLLEDFKTIFARADQDKDGFATTTELNVYIQDRNKTLEVLKTLSADVPSIKPVIDQVAKAIRDKNKVAAYMIQNATELSQASDDDPTRLSVADLVAVANQDGTTADLTDKDRYLARIGSNQAATFTQIAQEADGTQMNWVNNAYQYTQGATDNQTDANELSAYVSKLRSDQQGILDQAGLAPSDQQTALFKQAYTLRQKLNAAVELQNQYYTLQNASPDNPDTLSKADILAAAGKDGQGATLNFTDEYLTSSGSRSLDLYLKVVKDADERDGSHDPDWYASGFAGEDPVVNGDGQVSVGDLWRVQQDYYQKMYSLKSDRQNTTDAATIAQIDQQIFDLNEKEKAASRMVQRFTKLDNDTTNDQQASFNWGVQGWYQTLAGTSKISVDSLKTTAAKDKVSTDVTDFDAGYTPPNPWESYTSQFMPFPVPLMRLDTIMTLKQPLVADKAPLAVVQPTAPGTNPDTTVVPVTDPASDPLPPKPDQIADPSVPLKPQYPVDIPPYAVDPVVVQPVVVSTDPVAPPDVAVLQASTSTDPSSTLTVDPNAVTTPIVDPSLSVSTATVAQQPVLVVPDTTLTLI